MKDRAETKTYFIGPIGIRFFWSLDGCWTIDQQDTPEKYTPWLYFGPVEHAQINTNAIMIVLWKFRAMIGATH